nr:50S ribosomal protein L11 methyltransferase [Gammaproteobacteria bacterium]
MPWWELTVECDQQELEQVEDILLELGAISINIADAQDEPIYEPLPGESPLWSQSRISALFEQTLALQELKDQLVTQLPTSIALTLESRELQDEVWERSFLERYQPLQFGSNLWICPSWLEPPDPAACNIILDPGLAFGTGSHPTTALCLEFLDQHPPRDHSVLDYGCGSGILAIAAFKLGASRVSCIDIDPQALTATADNARRNDIDPELLHISLPDQQALQPVDYLMANILSGPLIELEAKFAELILPGGRLL